MNGIQNIIDDPDYDGWENYQIINFLDSLIQCGKAVIHGIQYVLVDHDEYFRDPNEHNWNARTVFCEAEKKSKLCYMINHSESPNDRLRYTSKPVIVEAKTTTKWVPVHESASNR